jgi:hypothetical protein
MENETSKIKIAMIIVAVVLIAVVGYLVYKYKFKSSVLNSPATFGGQISDQIQNPGSAVPDANPYDTKTNPYEAKVNPFRDTYQNPFK